MLSFIRSSTFVVSELCTFAVIGFFFGSPARVFARLFRLRGNSLKSIPCANYNNINKTKTLIIGSWNLINAAAVDRQERTEKKTGNRRVDDVPPRLIK